MFLKHKTAGLMKKFTSFALALIMAAPCFVGMAEVIGKAIIYAAEASELVVHYTFDDANSLGRDSSGKGNDGKVSGNVTAADGIRGGAAYFDSSNYGKSEAYITMPKETFKLREFTYSAFIKTDIEKIGEYARLFAIETSSADRQLRLMARPGELAASYTAELYGGSPSNVSLKTEGLVDRMMFDSWHHVTLTYDGSELKLYLNGSLIYSQSVEADISSWDVRYAYLGRTSIGTDPSYMGYMDDVKIYSKALSEAEIGKRIGLTEAEMGSYVKLLSGLKIDGNSIDAFNGFNNMYFYAIKEGAAYPTVTAEAPFEGTSIEVTQAKDDINYAEIKVKYSETSVRTVRVYFLTKMDGVYHPMLTDVNIDDEFWNDIIKRFLEVTAPYVLDKWANNTLHGLVNFDKVARGDRNTKNYEGNQTWLECEFYASMAGASLFLQKYENEALKRQIESYIARIYAASESESSGYFSIYNLLMTDGVVFGDGINPALSMDLYNLGYLIEFGINWYKATGDARMLRVALRFLNFTVDYSKGGTVNFISFHPSIEYNLIALYEFLKENPQVKNEEQLKDINIDEELYFMLANSLLSYRGNHSDPPRENGRDYGTYGNDHFTYKEIDMATGHIVEAMLYYYALSEMGRVSGDDSFTNAAYRLWDNTVTKQMYITGGIGCLYETEALGGNYMMPNFSYTETCASCALLQYSNSLSMMFRESKFQDIVERELYNNILGGTGENGKTFFYMNSLYTPESDSNRYSWHAVACCTKYGLLTIGNLPRNIYSYIGNDIYADQYIGSTATVRLDSGNVILKQVSSWAWEGVSTIKITDGAENLGRLLLRIPEWSAVTNIYVNGTKVDYKLEMGYAVLDRDFTDGDEIRIEADMSIQREYSDPRVKTNEDKVALRRGVFIYCLEEADNKHASVDDAPLYALLPKESEITLSEDKTLYGGVKTLKAAGKIYMDEVTGIDTTLTFIPFYARANRGSGAINVWIAEEPSAIENLAPVLPEEVSELKSLGVRYKAATNQKNPQGSGGATNISVIVDGKIGYTSNSEQYDGFGATISDSEGKKGRVWYSVEFSKACTVSYVVFYEGGHWNNGGWFGATPTVQAEVDGKWVDVALTIGPDYPGDSWTYQLPAKSNYTFTFDEPVDCTAIRVIGKKTTCSGGHVSCSEIEVYGKIAEPKVELPDNTDPTDTSGTEVTDSITTTAPAVDDKKPPVGIIIAVIAGVAVVAAVAVTAIIIGKKKRSS